MSLVNTDNTLEWFGATTYRLNANGLTIILDTYIDRPSKSPQYLTIDSIKEADYICISHAHFDHLPGCDRLAISTGAHVIASCESVNLLRKAGVPEQQLIPVAGGERIPLFTKNTWDEALRGDCKLRPGPPGAPNEPHHSLAVSAIDVWPSLHALIGGSHDVPDVFDTGSKPEPFDGNPFASTMDITRGMKYGLLQIDKLIPENHMDDGMKSFIAFVKDPKNILSAHDGGQLMYNIRLFDLNKTILWNAHLGAYEGIMRDLDPKPDLAILGAPGIANHNGRPFAGSAAEFLKLECEWLDHPSRVVWCLHDDATPIKPFRADTTAATQLVNAKTKSQVWTLKQNEVNSLF